MDHVSPCYPPKNSQEKPVMRTATVKETPPSGWDDAVGKFLVWLSDRNRSPKTIRCYKEELAAFGTWFRSATDEAPELRNVTAADLRQWKESLTKAELRPATVNKKRAALKSFMRWLEERGFSDPIEFPDGAKRQKPAVRWLTRLEERALIRAVQRGGDKRDIALIKTLLHCGLRIEEAAALRWNALKLTDRKGWMTVVGKGRKERKIPVDVEARDALKELSSGWRMGRDQPVFEGQRGTLTVSALHRIVVHYAKLAGLPDVTAHNLRHTCGKRLIESGARLEEVAAILGHENLNTTRQYVEPGEEDLEKAVERRAGRPD
jgi:site-specific recombinase XerD